MSEEQTRDFLETNANYFHNVPFPCIFYTNKKSAMERLLRRNPNCKVKEDPYGWILEYPKEEVRDPALWLRKKGEKDEE